MISYHTLLWYYHFDTVFIFIVNSYKYQSIPANIVRKINFDAQLLTESLWSKMNVHSLKPWYMKYIVTQNFRFTVDMVFVLNFFISLMRVWLEKITVLIICMHKRVKSIIFAMSIRFCCESGLAILTLFCINV